MARCTVLYMAPLPVIAGVYRVSIEWTRTFGCAPVNVLHIRSPLGAVGETEATIAALLNDAGPLFAAMPEDFTTGEIKILPLNGLSPTSIFGLDNDALTSGDNHAVPSVAALVSLRTNIRGPKARGRVYVGPVGEGYINDGLLAATARADMVAAWGDFQDAIIAADMELVVASYVHEEAYLVNQIQHPEVLATQRRRQDQLRV